MVAHLQGVGASLHNREVKNHLLLEAVRRRVHGVAVEERNKGAADKLVNKDCSDMGRSQRLRNPDLKVRPYLPKIVILQQLGGYYVMIRGIKCHSPCIFAVKFPDRRNGV